MSIRWFIGFAMLLILLTLICGWVTGVFYDTTQPTLTTVFMQVFNVSSTNASNANTGALTGWNALPQVWPAIMQALSFDYPFFTGFWIIFRLLFMCISVGFVWGIIQILYQSLRSIIPIG
jgi:hypothetical protein